MKQVVKPILTQSCLGSILNFPIYERLPNNDNSFRSIQIETINFLSLSLICINFLLSFLNFRGNYQLNGIVSLFALTVLLLNKWQYFTISRWLFILGIYTIIILLSVTSSVTLITDLVFIVSLTLMLLLFSKDEKWELLGSTSLLVALFIWLQITDLSPLVPDNKTDNLINQVFLLNISCILLSVVLAIYYIFSIYEKSENNLKMYVQELQAKEVEIKLQNEELLRLNANLLASKEDLVKSHIFLNSIIDNLPVTLFVKEAKELKFIRLNKTGEILTKYTEKEIVNKTNADLFPTDQAKNFTQSDIKTLSEKTAIETEEFLTNKDNQTHIIHTKKVPIYNNNGDPLYIIGISEDITPRKQAEEMLRKTVVELEIRNHELDNYVYRVSHDLRSPLCSILGLINLTKAENNVQVIKHYINLIEGSVSKSDQFIQSILNHSKILNTEPQVQLIEFEKMIYECLEEFNYMAEKDKIQINVNIKATSEFYSDEFRINIILRNVISNALKYFNPDLAKRYVTFDITIDEKQAEITIHDNGIGIESQYLPKVFDMFFRGTEKSTGSGLGLYIAKQATETLKGSITVASKSGEGTKFNIILSNKHVSVLK